MKVKYLPILLLFLLGCKERNTMFTLVPAKSSGLYFINNIAESDTLNALTFEYIYNGAGVATADFNNDGLADIFLAGNITSSKLFLNKGDLKFEDVTAAAGVSTAHWCTGVSAADVNGDGWMDLYVSTIHPDIAKSAPNLFFINEGTDDKGVPHFSERAGSLGVADSAYSSQAVFLDYDLDGDLDMYLLTNAIESYTRNAPIGQRRDGTGKSVDKLFKQDTVGGAMHFTDVSARAGILEEGWGLGIIVNDFNQDGWPDIYCANDFLSSDQLYINRRDGTFVNDISKCMNHQEFNGMGTDMADLNNDGLNDLVVVDMMPDDNLRQKTMFSGTGYDRFSRSIRMGYQPQYVRNVLQRNNGNMTFSDVGYQAGIYATDWSWSALLADFDNDGLRDILFTNGYPKDITDMDFVAYSKDASRFGTEELKRRNAAKAIRDLGGVFKPNFIYRNLGDLSFANVAAEWGLGKPAYSNGAAYADLDNDGDLDLVIANLNDEVHLYRNNVNAMRPDQANYLKVAFKGTAGNRQGLGGKVWVYTTGEVHYAEQQLQRGYLSSVDPVMHVGLGPVATIDSVVVVWPGGRRESRHNVQANRLLTLSVADARRTAYPSTNIEPLLALRDVPAIVQHENEFVDFKSGQATLPHKFSQSGPPLAVGDINGDRRDDFIVGGPAHNSAKIGVQQPDGTFRLDSLPAKDAEDTGLLLFDADNDGDNDLYCVSGSSEFGRQSEHYQDRLYLNDGKGKFTLTPSALPRIESSGSCVVAADIDHDNDLDLFVGGRVIPVSYPLAPRSYLLINEGGTFTDRTAQIAQALDSIGMVTSAAFADIDNDGWTDLIVAGEWMPVTVFSNRDGKLSKTREYHSGWWNSLAPADYDGDGDTDFIAGNLGLNTVLQASPGKPVSVYASDFDNNGSTDMFISRYNGDREYPVHYRETMTEQVAGLRKILKSYADFGRMEMKDVLNFFGKKEITTKRVEDFRSSYFENTGDGNFVVHPLPSVAQTSPLNSIVVCDVNGDSKPDFLGINNSFSEEPLSGNYDAGIGLCALGNGDGTFRFLPPAQSGFCVRTDARAIASITAGGNQCWLISSNQAPLVMYSKKIP